MRMAGPNGLRKSRFVVRVWIVAGKVGRGVVAWRQKGCGREQSAKRAHGAAAWCCSAEPTSRPASLRGKWNKSDEALRWMTCDQKSTTSVSKLLASSSSTKLMRSMCGLRHDTLVSGSLTVVHNLRVEACNVELSQRG